MVRSRMVRALLVGVAVLGLAACGGGDASPAACEPASAQAVNDIRGVLEVYPEIGATLADGAQQVAVEVPIGGTTSELRTLVAGRLQPSGEVGLWGLQYLTNNGNYVGPLPLNAAAIASMPEAAATVPEAASAVQQVVASEAAATLVACIK